MIVTTVAGRLGKDAELRDAGGTPVCNFSIATNVGYGEREQTHWFDCSLWGKRGESLARYLLKGGQVTVTGEQGEREYEGKVYKTLRVSDLALQGSKSAEGGTQPAQQQPAQQQPLDQYGTQAPVPPPPTDEELADEIPF